MSHLYGLRLTAGKEQGYLILLPFRCVGKQDKTCKLIDINGKISHKDIWEISIKSTTTSVQSLYHQKETIKTNFSTSTLSSLALIFNFGEITAMDEPI